VSARHALLTVEEHGDLRVRSARGAEYGDAVMSCFTAPDEFRRVQATYPILFRRDPDSGRFAAQAMFGFEAGENLFLRGDRWDAGYRPLAIDVQPFLIGGPPAGGGDPQVHIDLASPRLGDDGVRLFDETGRPTPFLEDAAAKLGDLHAAYQAQASFYEALTAADLLEPLTLEVTLDDGSVNRLVGYHVVDEDRLRDLDAGTLVDLHAAGHLMPLFMAAASLANIDELVRRKNASVAAGG